MCWVWSVSEIAATAAYRLLSPIGEAIDAVATEIDALFDEGDS